jgi:hypothetical protein
MTAEDLRSDDAWWRIYEDSFPKSERESPEIILESLRRGVGMALRIRNESVTFGLATTHLLMNPPAVFLVYLAIAREERSRGAGAALLQSSWEKGASSLWEKGLRPLGMIWEVDTPNPDSEDAEARRKRIAFFERNGGMLLDRPYLQPPIDGIATVPMRLMFRAAEGDTPPSPEMVEGYVRALYFEKYGAINGIERTILEDMLRRG